MNTLNKVLKKSDTLLVGDMPQDCPACHCPRFERVSRSAIDKLLGRHARFVCIKCGKATLVITGAEAVEHAAQVEEPDYDKFQIEARKRFLLGSKYAKGDGVKKNEKTAYVYFSQAAELGHAAAQVNTGIYLLKGLGTAQDIDASYQWLAAAAGQGNVKATALLPKVASLLENDPTDTAQQQETL